jgi:hypothetical protein
LLRGNMEGNGYANLLAFSNHLAMQSI